VIILGQNGKQDIGLVKAGKLNGDIMKTIKELIENQIKAQAQQVEGYSTNQVIELLKESFDFKCAKDRTCDAWITGGPLSDTKE
jgi:hypothetical protein